MRILCCILGSGSRRAASSQRTTSNMSESNPIVLSPRQMLEEMEDVNVLGALLGLLLD